MKTVAFFDLETIPKTSQISDIGCLKADGATFHDISVPKFLEFINGSDFICGHNIFRHDLVYLQQHTGNNTFGINNAIDTLFLSPLLFPSYPYHGLLKDDKLQSEERNNPVNDSKKARDLFYDEVAAFNKLSQPLQTIYFNLLHQQTEFSCFFSFLNYANPISSHELESLICSTFENKICQNADLGNLIAKSPVSLAYCLALINVSNRNSITPSWVLHSFPDVDRIMFLLKNNPCITGCSYCDAALDPVKALNRYFNHTSFRSYDGKPLQENAVRAAINNKSLLAVFPTGGGKSITFQIPALMSGENARALTVVISPLQSLMKDQVDNLIGKDINDAVTINGLLDPVARQNAIERIEGIEKDTAIANILYISPESLRSATIERLLLGRKIARFVIDEAHCFSSWGQDFRVDYLYIAEFIKNLQEKKGLKEKIPVSCFTATAKQKVIEDIRTYFKENLELDLEIFRASASRTNLHYKVFPKESDEEKYAEVRRLLDEKQCPTIIYVSRTKRAYQLAKRLCDDGFNAKPYHGKMDKDEKIENQEAFIKGDVEIMVATSAFGMGVDKDNVGMVIHYEISDSLENYVQEAGRAGRKETIVADCYVLFNEEDLDKHFILLNQTKLNCKEINQIWKAIKELAKTKDRVTNSALEIARKAGWDDNIKDVETRVITAIAALEDARYIKRGQNKPRVYADSILAKTAQEAIEKIKVSAKFNDEEKVRAERIIKKLFSSKSKRLATEEIAESRIDYISDHLGIDNKEVIKIVNLLSDEKILAGAKDLTAFIRKGENSNRSLAVVEKYRMLEEFFFKTLKDGEEATYNLKEINEQASESGCKDVSLNKIKTLLNFWTVKNWIKKEPLEYTKNLIQIIVLSAKDELKDKMAKRHFLARFIIEYLYQKINDLKDSKIDADEVLIEFSELELKEAAEKGSGLFSMKVSLDDIEDTLFYLSRIEAIKIEGGFLVVYNKLEIKKLQQNNRIQYKDSDYQKLSQFYQSKVHQIHIVGEYAKKMIQDYKDALQFVDDYFRLNYTSFLNKYFPGKERQEEIGRTMTPAKFRQLILDLSPAQQKIILDKTNKPIVVAAGPGSGKTRVLVHKLASLLLMEDVKHEQLLMLTFSRAAATEFKKRLLALIGNAANFVDIKTFHSFCFDLLGKVGNLTQSDSIIRTAIEKIKSGDIEPSKITRTVLVIDEAQDMNLDEYNLVQTLIEQNEDLRMILVGDDDQNIFGFRGASSKYMQQLIEAGAVKYELTTNYRCKANLVDLANQWATRLPNRLKDQPIAPHKPGETGNIKIVQYASDHLIAPLVDDINATGLAGSTCVLTQTNDEAAQLTGLLLKQGYTARLIQSNDNFKLYHLSELRFFTNMVNQQQENNPVINDEDWEEAKNKLNKEFKESNKLEWCRYIIEDFERINPASKYKSDWKAFLMESKFEDFVRITGDVIIVSTIHKAKGKEFDNTFLLLNKFDIAPDESKRQLYVALTRAKSNLAIHYTGTYLQGFLVNNLTYTKDNFHYPSVNAITLLLTHHDVKLGYFEFVQHRLAHLRSGHMLNITPEGLTNSKGETVLQFSKPFLEKINSLASNGYKISEAKVNFIVYWYNLEKDKEVKVLLPELTLDFKTC
ncbi:RecQ family ATP-dependent DNA helicase [Chitinophagaceae bacterium LB-8]|uniref:DNA 3'-5' helicase n=1 Tax=Paraflavisolibacter caeni TaxID=2982496 RepID=A0A9X3BFX7_9BACT|nr:RecQ family ATP-dependent DNA helicase [Paraflavisolibacter caeni]MCU7549834.1 RecQ family ATP-dependent DNA helicase [Paraflavisolibacter caeni]